MVIRLVVEKRIVEMWYVKFGGSLATVPKNWDKIKLLLTQFHKNIYLDTLRYDTLYVIKYTPAFMPTVYSFHLSGLYISLSFSSSMEYVEICVKVFKSS